MTNVRIDSDSAHIDHLFTMFPTVEEITGGNVTYLKENFVNVFIRRNPNGSVRTDTTPNAVDIVSHMKDINSKSQVYSSVSTYIYNSGSYDVNIVAGTGITLHGTMTISPGDTALFLIRIENDTPSSESVDIYRININVSIPIVTERTVSSIIDGTYYNPDGSLSTWNTNDAIVFETNKYIYVIDGSDSTDVDNTTDVVPIVLKVSMTLSEGFFQNDGDKLRFNINWRDYADGRLIISFSNLNFHDVSFVRNVNTFSDCLINTAVTAPNYNINWIGYDNNDQPVIQDTALLHSNTRNLLMTSKTNDDEPLVLEIERLNNTQLRARFLDFNLNLISGQYDIICNEIGDFFNNTNVNKNHGQTNNDGIFVSDITYIYIQEISSSEIDLKVQRNP